MSLILSSERNSKMFRNKSSILSPSFLNTSETVQQNKAPFNSKMEKFFDFSGGNKNPVGPGEYYRTRNSSFIKRSFGKNIVTMDEINNNDLYNIALFKIANKKKSLKLNAQKSLIIDKENKNQVFNINNINNISNNFNKSSSLDETKRNYKLIQTTLTRNRISSIPSKDHYLGYDFDKNGIPIMVDSDSIFAVKLKQIEDEKNNLIIKEKKINALDWSKMSKRSVCLENNNNSNINNNEITTKENSTNVNNNINKDIYEITSNLTSTNNSNIKTNKKKMKRNKSTNSTLATNNELSRDKNNFSKIFKTGINDISPDNQKMFIRYKFPERNRHWYKKRKKTLEEYVYDNLFNGGPGPGYYHSDSNFDKYEYYKFKNTNHNFGSNALRNGNFSNYYNNTKLGPGAYFKEEYKKKIKVDFYPLNRKEPGLNIKKYEKDFDKENVGPGKYEIKSQFDKTQLYYNGPLEKRFFDLNKKNELGPGEYLPLCDWNKYKDENKIFKNNIKDKINKENKGRDSYIIKNNNPGVGDYNPHIVSSIKYDIISKENKMSNIRTPFSSGQERFLYKSPTTSDLLGPGKYFSKNKSFGNVKIKRNKDKGLYKIDAMDNDEIKNIYAQYKLEAERIVGPGSYDLHNYNEWHKKSFNVNSFKSDSV